MLKNDNFQSKNDIFSSFSLILISFSSLHNSSYVQRIYNN